MPDFENIKHLTKNHHKASIDQIIDAISESIIIIDKKYKILLLNNAAEELFGIMSKDALGADVHELLEIYDAKNIPINPESFCFKKSKRRNAQEETILVAKNSKHIVDIKSAIIDPDNPEEECLIMITDITKVKDLEKTKDEFLSVASHELRTPMTIIKSYLWMISTERHGPLTAKQKEYITKAILSTERMIELINDILNVSRIEQNALNVVLNRVEMKDLVEELVSDFKVKADEKGLKLYVTCDSDKLYAYVDTSKLREILVNLVGNSLKFTEMGEIRIDIQKAGDFTKVSVIDSGRGIKQNELERLFHKFGRLDSSYQTVAESEGTGLGLYIVKLFVDAMGGKIGVFSDGVGKGATFWFTLPRKKKHPGEISFIKKKDIKIETEEQPAEVKKD